MTVSLSTLQIRALLLDIEGTTTPVEFVYQVLFPYARAHAAEYLARNRNQPTFGTPSRCCATNTRQKSG